jgi:formate hydrogenlyase subunit 6
MIAEAIKNLFRRRSTQQRTSVPKAYRGRHVYEPEKCKGYGMCVRYCPTNAIKFRSDKKVQIDLSRCIFCGMCEEVCPTGAIKLSESYDMATEDKSVINEEVKK